MDEKKVFPRNANAAYISGSASGTEPVTVDQRTSNGCHESSSNERRENQSIE